MNVLVTGAQGFLGRRLVSILLEKRVGDLRLVGRRPDDEWLMTLRRAHPGAAIEFCVGDLTDRAFAGRAADGVGLVFHLAAGMRGNPADIIYNSVVAADYLFGALAEAGRPKVVLVSSLAVYDVSRLRHQERLTENTPLESRPYLRDPYTYAKWKQEQLLQKYRLPHVVVRPGFIYGEGGTLLPSRLGLPLGPFFLHLAGRGWLPLTHVENCAEAIALAGLAPLPNGTAINIIDDELLRAHQYRRLYSARVKRLRTFPVPYPCLMSLARFLEWYHHRSRGQLPAVLTPYRVAAQWKRCVFDNSRAKTLLGWQPRVGLKEGLDRAFRYHRARLESGV